MAGKKQVKSHDSILEWGEGNITRKPGSKRLYFDFRYFDERVEISTGLVDTEENQKKALAWLFVQRERMKNGTFRFAEAFPNASAEKKAFFSAKEGTEFTSRPQHVKFGEFITAWYKDVWCDYDSETKKIDYRSSIDYWILPFFGNLTFFEINTTVVGKFIKSLKQKKGKKANKNVGKPLSRKRILNLFLPLRAIWVDACEQYRWELPDPFRKLSEQLPDEEAVDECLDDNGCVPQPKTTPRQPLRFDAFMNYLDYMDPFYRPVAELWMLTGMIPSEMAGITPLHIRDGYLYVRRSISRGVERKKGKSKYRRREIKITSAIQRVLDVFLARPRIGVRLIALKKGGPLTATEFYDAWVAAEKKAQLRHRTPYCLRHSFAAWALTVGIDPNRLVSLMGHGSKKMVYEVYGEYVEGLEHDREKILSYFGEDFVAGELRKAA